MKTQTSSSDVNTDFKFVDSYGNWTRFWIGTATDKTLPLTKLTPFVLNKAILGMVGEVKDVKFLKNGLLFVEVDQRSHALNLLKTKMLNDIPVEFTPHRTLNHSSPTTDRP